MVNNIQTGPGFNFTPASGLQTEARIQGPVNTPTNGEVNKKLLGPKECKTWKSRTYKDRSGDPSVSFQSPTHLSPDMAATAVQAHEQEHVAHNAESAQKQGMKAHSTVTLNVATCPEWGRTYVSGGTTTTTYSPKQPSPGTGPEQNKGNFIDTIV